MESKILPKVKEPIYVSHRGNLNGSTNNSYENSRAALDNLIGSGFDWVEVDVQVTSDGVPVLIHDPYIETDNNNKVYIDTLTLDELKNRPGLSDILTLEEAVSLYSPHINLLIEVKTVPHVLTLLHLGREVARIIRERPGNNIIIVDSFQDGLVVSIKAQCNCEAGLDAPYQKQLSEEDLKSIQGMNMDWVYVYHSVITPGLIRGAHKLGLKVMAYTVNSKDIIETWALNELPDGIITDNIAIIP